MVNSAILFYEANKATAMLLIATPIITMNIGISVVCILLLTIALYVYRYTPYKYVDMPNNIIMSPANGTITNIKILPTHIFVSIHQSIYDRHYITSPCNGNIISNSELPRRCNILLSNYSLVSMTYRGKQIEQLNNIDAGCYLTVSNLTSDITLLFPIRSADGQSMFYLNTDLAIGQKINHHELIGQYILF